MKLVNINTSIGACTTDIEVEELSVDNNNSGLSNGNPNTVVKSF